MNVSTLLFFTTIVLCVEIIHTNEVDCDNLRMGQYLCPDPRYNHIDSKTQQLKGCRKDNKAKVWCIAVEGIICSETKNTSFTKEMNCKWTNGYSFETSLLLSVFLGMFGADRFYLGYPALGLAKFCTLGFMFLGQLIDIILIATQALGPADGSAYIIPYYGPSIDTVRSDNWTYRLKQDDCLSFNVSVYTIANKSEDKSEFRFKFLSTYWCIKKLCTVRRGEEEREEEDSG